MPRRIPKAKIEFFQNNLLEWYEKHAREFYWRKEGITPYEIIISEVLLQRTKAETIAKFLPTFLKVYPSWSYITESSLEDLKEVLRPVGLYTQRANRLYKLAQEMKLKKYKIPEVVSELNEMSMFGQYITNAAKLLIHKTPAPLLDVNMARVLERFFGPRELADIRYDPYLQELAQRVIEHQHSKELNWAILDFAASICKAIAPRCPECLMKNRCLAYKKGLISYTC